MASTQPTGPVSPAHFIWPAVYTGLAAGISMLGLLLTTRPDANLLNSLAMAGVVALVFGLGEVAKLIFQHRQQQKNEAGEQPEDEGLALGLVDQIERAVLMRLGLPAVLMPGAGPTLSPGVEHPAAHALPEEVPPGTAPLQSVARADGRVVLVPLKDGGTLVVPLARSGTPTPPAPPAPPPTKTGVGDNTAKMLVARPRPQSVKTPPAGHG